MSRPERVSHVVAPAGSDYEAVEVEVASGERRGGSASRRALVMSAIGAAMSLCCFSALSGGGVASGNALALGIKNMVLSAAEREQHIFEKETTEGLVIGKSADKKVKYFNLAADPSIGSQSSSWGYSGETGPSAWAKVAPEFALCASGQAQSPINVNRADAKAHLELPPLLWEGYEAEPYIQQGMETRAFYDGKSICMSGPGVDSRHPTGVMTGPRISVKGFSRYLPDLPLSAVTTVNYTLHEIRFHTPSEHLIDGQSFPFEMQMVHECNALTEPACPINKTMIVSVLFKEANVRWYERSPSFLSRMMDDLRLIEGVWSQYVESFAFDFGEVSLRVPSAPLSSLRARTCNAHTHGTHMDLAECTP
jgi:hypothetical protein